VPAPVSVPVSAPAPATSTATSTAASTTAQQQRRQYKQAAGHLDDAKCSVCAQAMAPTLETRNPDPDANGVWEAGTNSRMPISAVVARKHAAAAGKQAAGSRIGSSSFAGGSASSNTSSYASTSTYASAAESTEFWSPVGDCEVKPISAMFTV
jgi:hypothetical protein